MVTQHDIEKLEKALYDVKKVLDKAEIEYDEAFNIYIDTYKAYIDAKKG